VWLQYQGQLCIERDTYVPIALLAELPPRVRLETLLVQRPTLGEMFSEDTRSPLAEASSRL